MNGKDDEDLERMKALKGVLAGFPGEIKVESCTKPQHFRWMSRSPAIGSSLSSAEPGPMIGPLKETRGGMRGKSTAAPNVRAETG
jgi:hypothetical protein